MATQSIQARKLKSIERLVLLEDEELLSIIEQLLMPSEASDWAETLSAGEKKAIQTGLDDLKNGRSESFDDFETRMQRVFA